MQLHINNAANQDLAKSNNAGVALKLKQANKALKNDGSLMYGLGQRISQIAQIILHRWIAIPENNNLLLVLP